MTIAQSDIVRLEDSNFSNERVDIDGIEFVRCKFVNCTLVYSGGAPFLFTESPIDGCHIDFAGPAAATLEALTVAYGAGLHDWVEKIFNMVRMPFKPN